jgi:hypothetical protein
VRSRTFNWCNTLGHSIITASTGKRGSMMFVILFPKMNLDIPVGIDGILIDKCDNLHNW